MSYSKSRRGRSQSLMGKKGASRTLPGNRLSSPRQQQLAARRRKLNAKLARAELKAYREERYGRKSRAEQAAAAAAPAVQA